MSRDYQPRDGRRPDGQKHDESQHESHDHTRLDALNEELLEDGESAPIVEAVVATLDTGPPEGEPLAANGWESLRAKLAVEESRSAAGGSDEWSDAVQVSSRPSTEQRPWRSAEAETEVPTTEGPIPVPATSASRWLVAMVLVAAVVVAGSWGALKAGEVAKLRDDQRILAYWMSNPAMRMVALSEPGSSPQGADSGAGGEAGGEAENQAAARNPRLGIICFLPDGRALLLQPTPAPRGASYVVMGVGAAGTEELARGRATMLLFNADGMRSVEVLLARGGDDTEVVARATFN